MLHKHFLFQELYLLEHRSPFHSMDWIAKQEPEWGMIDDGFPGCRPALEPRLELLEDSDNYTLHEVVYEGRSALSKDSSGYHRIDLENKFQESCCSRAQP